MRASTVLTDHHVLDGLTMTVHVRTVRQIFPSGTVVVCLLLQNLVGIVSDRSGDIVGLYRAAGGTDKDDAVLTHEGTCN